MANPYWNKRRQSGGGASPGVVGYMASQGRAPSFDSAGSVRGFRSRPGASSSARETMGEGNTFGINREFGSGRTPDSEWDGFFNRGQSNPSPIIPSPDMSEMPYRATGTGEIPGLAPDVPQDAQAMAADLGDSQSQGDVPPVGKMSADDYLNQAIGDNEQWFAGSGERLPGMPSAVPESGTAFRSKYGRGTVSFDSSRPSNSYAARLKRLGEADIFDL